MMLYHQESRIKYLEFITTSMNMEFLILNKKLYKQIIFNVMTIVISFRIEFNLRFYGRETF